MIDNLLEEPEVTQTTPEEVSETDADATSSVPVSEPSEKPEIARNLSALREKALRAERERDELMRRLQEVEQAHKPQDPEEDNDITLGADELAEGKHLAKVGRKIKRLEEQLKNYQQESAVSSIESRLRAEYPDFNRVATRENVERLCEFDPDLAEVLRSSTNVYSKSVIAYKQIKKLGIYTEDTFGADRERVKSNASKPKSMASISPQKGDSPLSHANAFANGLTPELQAQLYKEMQEYKR